MRAPLCTISSNSPAEALQQHHSPSTAVLHREPGSTDHAHHNMRGNYVWMPAHLVDTCSDSIHAWIAELKSIGTCVHVCIFLLSMQTICWQTTLAWADSLAT